MRGLSPQKSDKREALHGLPVALDGLEEHLRGANPKPALAIKRTVNNHFLQRLGVLRESLKAIAFPLDVQKLPPNQTMKIFTHKITPAMR